MARSVHLSEQAYGLLAALKLPGESFSDVVTRLAAERRDPGALRRLKPPRDDFDLGAFRAGTAQADRDKLANLREER